MTALNLTLDFDWLRVAGRATAYPPLPVEPSQDRVLIAMAEDKPAPTPAPQPAPDKGTYTPLPVETDTREAKPGTRETK